MRTESQSQVRQKSVLFWCLVRSNHRNAWNHLNWIPERKELPLSIKQIVHRSLEIVYHKRKSLQPWRKQASFKWLHVWDQALQRLSLCYKVLLAQFCQFIMSQTAAMSVKPQKEADMARRTNPLAVRFSGGRLIWLSALSLQLKILVNSHDSGFVAQCKHTYCIPVGSSSKTAMVET